MRDPVEELLWTRLILAGGLQERSKGVLRTQLLGLQSPTPTFLGTRAQSRGWHRWGVGGGKRREDPASLALSGLGATVSRVYTGLGPGGSWACSGVLLGQPQFTSLPDPDAGNCSSRPGNVSVSWE